jgi:hypothetical protein
MSYAIRCSDLSLVGCPGQIACFRTSPGHSLCGRRNWHCHLTNAESRVCQGLRGVTLPQKGSGDDLQTGDSTALTQKPVPHPWVSQPCYEGIYTNHQINQMRSYLPSVVLITESFRRFRISCPDLNLEALAGESVPRRYFPAKYARRATPGSAERKHQPCFRRQNNVEFISRTMQK